MTTWASGLSLASGAKTANLVEAYIFGSTDAGKNLVNSNVVTTTLRGSAAYGSDGIGSYVAITGSGDALRLANNTQASTSTTDIHLIVFTREGARATVTALYTQEKSSGTGLARLGVAGLGNYNHSNTVGSYGCGTDFGAITTATEFAALWNGADGKFYVTGGSSATTVGGGVNDTNSTLVIGNYGTDFETWPATNFRIRAFFRWSTKTGMSDADLQDIASNPSQLVTAGGGGPAASSGLLTLGVG